MHLQHNSVFVWDLVRNSLSLFTQKRLHSIWWKVYSGSSTMNLPAEIVADILSRIPIKTIVHCRCVCTSWRNILSEPNFANLHLSRSPAGLIIQQVDPWLDIDILKFGEVDDKPDQHEIHHDTLISFDLRLLGFKDDIVVSLCGSINGLICLGSEKTICICNPITREYILIPDQKFIKKSHATSDHGFGFVKSSNQYKVVRFYKGRFPASEGSDVLGCEVYTLGTGMWRNIGHIPFPIEVYGHGIYVGGNLHWLADPRKDTINERLCIFDLDKELFQLTAGPAVPEVSGYITYRTLGILGGCLCICDNTPDVEFAIWVMKDYGVMESWRKEIVICTDFLYKGKIDEEVYPLKVLKDGTIIMYCKEYQMFAYHPATKSTQDHIFLEGSFLTYIAMDCIPSFISLKTFTLEKVVVF